MVLRRAVYRLALAGVWFAVATRAQDPPAEALDHGRRLAVVVPTYRGDLERAVASLGRWPSRDCSPLTQQSVDLVLYYGEGEEDREAVDAAAETVSETAGRCFAATRTVYAHVAEEVSVRREERDGETRKKDNGVRHALNKLSCSPTACGCSSFTTKADTCPVRESASSKPSK